MARCEKNHLVVARETVPRRTPLGSLTSALPFDSTAILKPAKFVEPLFSMMAASFDGVNATGARRTPASFAAVVGEGALGGAVWVNRSASVKAIISEKRVGPSNR